MSAEDEQRIDVEATQEIEANVGLVVDPGLNRYVQYLRATLIARGRSQPDMHARIGPCQQKAVRHVIAITHICQAKALQPALLFIDGQHIRQRLAWMLKIGKRIDYRHAAVARQPFQRSMCKGTRNNAVHIPAQYGSDIPRETLEKAWGGNRNIGVYVRAKGGVPGVPRLPSTM